MLISNKERENINKNSVKTKKTFKEGSTEFIVTNKFTGVKKITEIFTKLVLSEINKD